MRRMPLNAEELENIRYIEDFYDFSTEQLQKASKEPKYAKLIALMKEAPKNFSRSVLINDLTNQTLYTGTYNKTDIQLYAVISNTIEYIDINYDKSTDDMEINGTVESLLTEDNVKKIFGQDITGTGNIELYMHVLGLIKSKTEYGDTEYKILVTYYSDNNLKVDSLQDLTALTKASSTNNVILTGIAFYNAESGNPANTIYNNYCGVQFDGTNWRFRQITDTNTPTGALITAVSDIVTPI